MGYSHIIVKMNPVGKTKAVSHVETDLDKDFVLKNIITPYIEGHSIFVNGARIESGKVESIRVFESLVDYQQLYQSAQNMAELQRKNAASQGGFIMPIGITKEGVICSGETEEITRELFNKAQGI